MVFGRVILQGEQGKFEIMDPIHLASAPSEEQNFHSENLGKFSETMVTVYDYRTAFDSRKSLTPKNGWNLRGIFSFTLAGHKHGPKILRTIRTTTIEPNKTPVAIKPLENGQKIRMKHSQRGSFSAERDSHWASSSATHVSTEV